MDTPSQQFGRWVKEQGGQQPAAEILGADQGQISRWVNAKRRPNLENRNLILSVCGIDLYAEPTASSQIPPSEPRPAA